IQSQVSRQPAIHLITSEDAATLNVENLSAYKRVDGLFYRGAGPDALQPQAFDFGGSAAGFLAMVANGRLYHVTLPSTYCYLTPRAIDGSFDYKLADMLLTDEYYSGVIFNKTTSSVLFIDSNGNITTPANPANGYPHVNMNLDFIRFIDRNSMYYVRAFLLMAERDRSQYYLYNFYGFMTTAAPFANQEGESRIVLPASSALLKATASAGHPGRSVIYFSTGDHRLQMLTAAENPVENVVYTFDSSEKITSICTYTVKTFPNNYLDRFAVATTTADGGWKLYSFETDGVDLLPDPQVFSGTGGTVRSICYLP
ncbi:MAG: hypothetical protein LUD68_04045, partial [Rikenellaceae bacterium]|nr:hypothetical protein [Rikenellaceae bacterium]